MRAPLHAAVAAFAVGALEPSSRADTANFDLYGHTYTKFMYQNDNTQGCLSLSNPFWVDNIGGHNGVCTEFELNIKGRLGPRVTTGVRLQSRWGALWQDWWENGDLKRGISDTSGESLGMNHAAYIKLRGVFVRFAPPIPHVAWVTVGSTDYSMWNEWTIGKARYIDRDNGAGVFVEGDAGDKKLLSFTTGAMALPKLWAGPGWNTGLKDNEPLSYFYSNSWAYAVKLDSRPTSDLRLKAIGSWAQNWAVDQYSPFLTGAPDAARNADHSVNYATRFRGLNGTLDGVYTPARFESLRVAGLVAFSSNYVNPEYATNLVRGGQGFSPVVFKTDANGNPIASNGGAVKLDVEVDDPFHNGLTFKAEYFNIGSEYNAIMGARREADVLLTEGIITTGFIRGGQLPTLNVANEFVDFDEPWYETVIGWNGGTAVLEFVKGRFTASLEATGLTYNTNMQNRDTKNQYPDFLYTSGFTETYGYTADGDYANVYDRGRDPRSVYAQYQDRYTALSVLNVEWLLPGFSSVVFNGKAKYVYDVDFRKDGNPDDNYRGHMLLGYGQLSWQTTNELRTYLGTEFTTLREFARSGTEQSGFHDVFTHRWATRAGLSYTFGGVIFTYMLEYLHKTLDRTDNPAAYDELWNVWRSKATFEVGW